MIAWWDRLDANRERRERYHELSRSGDDVPLDYGASANELFFPDMLNDVLEKQLRKGDFIDAIFYCPYDIHELVTEEYLSLIHISIGLKLELAKGTIRLSFGRNNSENDVDIIIESLRRILG